MFLILLATVFTTSLFVCFKYFVKLNVNTYHAIVVNYFVAAFTSYLFAEKSFQIIYNDNWFKFSSLLGLLFILTFVATSITAQKVSLIISMIASKMSLVIPLTYAVIFIGEKMTLLKIIAIILAMTGVLLTVLQPKEDHKRKPRSAKTLLLIAAVFTGSGLVDSSFKFIEYNFYASTPPQYIMMVCYSSAAIFGTLFLVIKSIKTKPKITLRSVIAGFILGILNYFSFIFVLQALHSPLLPSTVVFPLVNVGVLLLSTFTAIVLFNERLRKLNYIGVVISILSIVVLALEHYAV